MTGQEHLAYVHFVRSRHPQAGAIQNKGMWGVFRNDADLWNGLAESSVSAEDAWRVAAKNLGWGELELVESPKVAQGAAKTPLALIPPVAAAAIARVHQNGADKYGPWNWRESKVPLMTYLHAMRRHLDAVLDGQDIDPDSGLPHVAHVAASCNIILDAQVFGTLVDDRPPVKKP